MTKKAFVMRGQTASGESEVLQFSGYKGKGYAYRLTEFLLYPSTNIGGVNVEICGSITAAKTAIDPLNPDFNEAGLIATFTSSEPLWLRPNSIVNDTFLITQNLILSVIDSAAGTAVNWQCRFESVKMSGPEEAAVNYKQFAISD